MDFRAVTGSRMYKVVSDTKAPMHLSRSCARVHLLANLKLIIENLVMIT